MRCREEIPMGGSVCLPTPVTNTNISQFLTCMLLKLTVPLQRSRKQLYLAVNANACDAPSTCVKQAYFAFYYDSLRLYLTVLGHFGELPHNVSTQCHFIVHSALTPHDHRQAYLALVCLATHFMYHNVVILEIKTMA